MDRLKLKKELQSCLLADIGHGDITSQAIFPMDEQGEGVFVAKQTGTTAGLDIIREAYQVLDPSMQITLKYADGDTVTRGQVIAEVQGYVAFLLTGERVILSSLQRRAGIATMTKAAVLAFNEDRITIGDTRKTRPGLRMWKNSAVPVGAVKIIAWVYMMES